MLDRAAFAFIILTGEDEQADGKVTPRLNVAHEVGLEEPANSVSGERS
jgi:hypothetical protein